MTTWSLCSLSAEATKNRALAWSVQDRASSIMRHALVAQWIERLRPKESVGGSIPSQGTKALIDTVRLGQSVVTYSYILTHLESENP